MKTRSLLCSILCLLTVLVMTQVSHALELPKIFATNMVLQRDMPIQVWGTAKASSMVQVSFADQSVIATADKDGKWKLTLESQPASAKPQSMTVTGDGHSINFENVLVGEVWICSGQSNMEVEVIKARDGEKEVESANDSMIRLCKLPRASAPQPLDDAQRITQWVECSPKAVRYFTAVGYYFGRQLRQELGIPIGLISSNWGGTPAGSWTSLQTLKANEKFGYVFERWDSGVKSYPTRLAQWEEQKPRIKPNAKNGFVRIRAKQIRTLRSLKRHASLTRQITIHGDQHLCTTR